MFPSTHEYKLNNLRECIVHEFLGGNYLKVLVFLYKNVTICYGGLGSRSVYREKKSYFLRPSYISSSWDLKSLLFIELRSINSKYN